MRSMPWLRALVLLTAVAHGAARADTALATLVEDTYVASTNPTTNYATPAAGSACRLVQLRALSGATRAGYIQFTLPGLAGAQLTGVDLIVKGGSVGSGFLPEVEVYGTATPIDLTTVTWNNAIGAGLLTGTGSETDYTPAWGAMWTSFGAETWNLDAITITSTETYSDTTAASGLLKFIADNLGAAPVTITLGLGFSATETSTGGLSLRTTNDHYPDAGYSTNFTPGSANTPVLRLTYIVPEPAALSLLALGASAACLRRRRAARGHG